MSRTDANSQHYKVGIVTEVHGDSLYATDTKGVVRQLSIGSNVFSDDKIESREGSSMIVQTSNGQSINIPEDVYDQMLSSAITKELSKSLDTLKESQEDSSTDPTSHNDNSAQDYAQNAAESAVNTLKLSDIVSVDEKNNQSGETLGITFSSYDYALLSPHIAEYSTDNLEDYSPILHAG